MAEPAANLPAPRFVRIYGPWDFNNAHSALADAATQQDFAGFYADCIRAGGTQDDWLRLNAAVAKRWPKGLSRVKTLAWKQMRPAATGSDGP